MPYCTNLYSKRLNILCHRRVGMFKCCHTGFEHAHNCHKVDSLIDVFAATSIVTLYVTVKVQSMQRACASLATSCQRCSDSFISKLNTRAMLGFGRLKIKYPSSGRIRASQR